jgi:hypothetical protein
MKIDATSIAAMMAAEGGPVAITVRYPAEVFYSGSLAGLLAWEQGEGL